MLHTPLTNLLLLAAKQESYKRAYLLTKYTEEFSGKSSEERTSRQKKIEKVTGLGRRNKRGDSKVESNDSPEIPDRGETSDIPGLPSGELTEENLHEPGRWKLERKKANSLTYSKL